MSGIILHGGSYSCLEELDNDSIAGAITSPPYWQQRDYGFKGQIGREPTVNEYIGRLVTIFNKLLEKMRDDGVFFLNVGDKYQSRYGKSHLLQIPYRLAYHMIQNGWILEDIIIWYKTNHMPSPVKDRFTNTYEPVLVFTKTRNHLYRKALKNVIKIPLQQTPWKHTAVFPEGLVKELLHRVHLNDHDIILDPFAGTGTVAFITNQMRNQLFPKDLFPIAIDKGDAFIDIIQKRTGIKIVKEVADIPYTNISLTDIPLHQTGSEILVSNKYGEVAIVTTSDEFQEALGSITTTRFKQFHREDALYLVGVKQWTIDDLYSVSKIFPEGYVLRNMLVISNDANWYPVFMFTHDSTQVAYRFYLDRIRVESKAKTEDEDWVQKQFVGLKVSDITGKTSQTGRIMEILQRYDDGFPKYVAVKWNGYASKEYVLHPNTDEYVREGVLFRCPYCKEILEDVFDPIQDNKCEKCGVPLWRDMQSLPLLEKPKEIQESYLEEEQLHSGEIVEIKQIQEANNTNSKFAELKRINWGASPGARKLMLGDYFTKMRLYRIDQPTVAQHLKILRKAKNMSLTDIVKKCPKEYKHTVGHWFRKDFGGSLPIHEDVKMLANILGEDNNLFTILEKKSLKFQSVMASIKGKNPGDFIEETSYDELLHYFKSLFIPSRQYLQ